MNRAKTILSSLRLTNSLLSTRVPRTPFLCSKVTHLFPPLSLNPHISPFLNTHQFLLFSSQPNSIVQVVLDNKWSKELEDELSISYQNLTHESVMYVLKKLDKDPEKASSFFTWVCDRKEFTPNSSVYGLALRILATKGTMKQFWATVKKMKELGFYIDLGTYLPVLKSLRDSKLSKDVSSWTELYNGMKKENETNDVAQKVFDEITKSNWGLEIKRELAGMKIPLSENFVLRVFRHLKNHPLKALNFFKWIGNDLGFEPNSVTYNAICRVLSREDSIGEFWNVLKEMRSLGHEMDIDTYIKISRGLRKSKMMKDAVELYEFMIDGPYKPSPQECSAILRSIALTGNPDMDLVFRVVKKYEESGNFLTKADYDGIHRSLTSVARFEEADKIVKTMKEAGFEPDNITYSQLIYGLCKARRLEEACKVLDEMKERDCEPDIKTWTILIQGHCLANEVEKALFWFAKMMETNIEADADLLGVLVKGFLNQEKVEGGYTLLLEMVEKARLRPWQATYKSLIEKLLEKGKLEEAMNVLHLMKKHNYPPFAEPFPKYISKFGTVDNADEFLKALTVKEYPSVTAYVHVFESFFKEGRYAEAKDLLYKCPFHIRKHEGVTKLFGSANSSSVTAA